MDAHPLPRLSAALRAKQPVFAAWITVSEPAIVETMLREGFGAAVLDMQHGGFDETGAIAAIAAGALADKPVIVRVPVEGYATASRMLDAGAAAIIAPMINDAAAARRFVSFAKFSPAGERSWGPGRAMSLSGHTGQDYLREANALQLALAMIETPAALAALDDILAVPGLDGVFVGPSDLSIAMSGGTLDPFSPAVDAALTRVGARAAQAGKVAGLFTFSGEQAKAMAARGFGLMTISSDLRLLAGAARVELAATM